MIAIVDYGVGNLASVRKAFVAVGAQAELVSEPAGLAGARAIVLPGVGHFGHCAREFQRSGFGPPLLAARGRGTPILGICVGMQLFFERSEEAADEPGLGLLRGTVAKMRGVPRLPQIGWNRVRLRGRHPWLGGMADGDFAYFVHSYAAEPEDGVVLGTTDYGTERVAIVGDEGLLGVQFHPEKSSAPGLRLLDAFATAAG